MCFSDDADLSRSFHDTSLQCPSIDITAKFFVCALDLHSVNMNGDFQDFWSNFTYSGKNQGECGKITVLTLCRVNVMVNKIYFDFQTSCRKISCSCIDFARGTIPTHSDRAITLYRGGVLDHGIGTCTTIYMSMISLLSFIGLWQAGFYRIIKHHTCMQTWKWWMNMAIIIRVGPIDLWPSELNMLNSPSSIMIRPKVLILNFAVVHNRQINNVFLHWFRYTS